LAAILAKFKTIEKYLEAFKTSVKEITRWFALHSIKQSSGTTNHYNQNKYITKTYCVKQFSINLHM